LGERLSKFDLKLLTASKEVGLRRLRSYAASLGGGAQIFNSYDDLRRSLEANFTGRRAASIVLHDDTIPLGPTQFEALTRVARVFVLHRPDERRLAAVPPAGAPCWGMESYMQCTLGTFLESPLVRMCMAQLCTGGAPFHLEHLLRWGHASQTWVAKAGERTVGDASFAFIKSLNLTGEARRLTEMFTHFLEASLPALGLAKECVTFGSDGLLTMVTARCTEERGANPQAITAELRVHDFPIAVSNRLGERRCEVAGLYYPFQPQTVATERIVMAFSKDSVAASELALLPLHVDKAG
jgi:hypothetical protein